jgi:hypothetical protein
MKAALLGSALAVVLAAAASTAAVAVTPAATPIKLRIVGISPSETVNLRERPSRRSHVLSHVPPGTRGLSGLGIATDRTGRPTVKSPFWCGVEYDSKSGWIACKYLTPDDAGH